MFFEVIFVCAEVEEKGGRWLYGTLKGVVNHKSLRNTVLKTAVNYRYLFCVDTIEWLLVKAKSLVLYFKINRSKFEDLD